MLTNQAHSSHPGHYIIRLLTDGAALRSKSNLLPPGDEEITSAAPLFLRTCVAQVLHTVGHYVAASV